MKPSLNPLTSAEVRSVAEQLGVKPGEVTEMESRMAGQEIALDPAVDDDDSTYAPIAYLADRSPQPPELLEDKQEQSARASGLESALASLDPRSRRIVEARWLREKDSATLHDLAEEFKVSAERIRQIEVKALAKMKGVIAAR